MISGRCMNTCFFYTLLIVALCAKWSSESSSGKRTPTESCKLAWRDARLLVNLHTTWKAIHGCSRKFGNLTCGVKDPGWNSLKPVLWFSGLTLLCLVATWPLQPITAGPLVVTAIWQLGSYRHEVVWESPGLLITVFFCNMWLGKATALQENRTLLSPDIKH